MLRPSLIALVAVCVALTHCDRIHQQAPSEKHPPASSDSGPRSPSEERVKLGLIEITDLEVQPLANRALTGDLRPYYLASGRIENHTGKRLQSLTIRIYAEASGSPLQTSPQYNKDWEGFDQADVRVDGPINEDWPKGFSQQIQLLVPKGKLWTFEADVVDAKLDTRVE